MKIKVKKTDKRMTGYSLFKYYIDIKYDRSDNFDQMPALEKFFEIRQWCWETWGPSREVDEFNNRSNSWMGDQNVHWAWINDAYRARLYLADTEEAAYITLKWT
jgi:hypothetical protein